MSDFSSAVKHFTSGISFLRANYWQDQYELSLSLHEFAALANYSGGQHEPVVGLVNQVLSNAKSFEDKFKSYCTFINVTARGSTDRASEKLCELLRPLGESINPNSINPKIVIKECMNTRDLLSGDQKDLFLQSSQLTDRTKLMAMKLMAMLVLYCGYKDPFLGGHLVCRMIRISLQFGHCEDTVYALSTFAMILTNRLHDIDEGYALAHTALSLMKLHNVQQLIPRCYGLIYGMVLHSKDSICSLLDPLLKACRLSFLNGNFEDSFNTIMYICRCWQDGKQVPLLLNELIAFAQHFVSME